MNNWQLNWDAINTISNILLILALVGVTYWYARKVSEQTTLMIKDRKRNKILEEVQRVLTPISYNLTNEIEAIRGSKTFWYKPRETGILDNLFKFFYDKVEYNGAFKDVIEKFPYLEEKVISHDNLYDKLNELYTETEKEIRTPKLEKRLKVLVNEFNQSRQDPYKLRGDHLEKPEFIFGNFIINKWEPERSPDSIEPHIDFWEENKGELLKFRNTPRVKELGQLKELDEDILDKVREIREKYRKEYQFTDYEIDPRLKEFEEW